MNWEDQVVEYKVNDGKWGVAFRSQNAMKEKNLFFYARFGIGEGKFEVL